MQQQTKCAVLGAVKRQELFLVRPYHLKSGPFLLLNPITPSNALFQSFRGLLEACSSFE